MSDPKLFTKYSDSEAQQLMADAFDDTKVQLYCGLHKYYGPVKNPTGGMHKIGTPHAGCARCWFVYYFHDIASTPPHLRQERLDELEEVVHKTVEAVNRDEFDFKVSRRPEVSIEKDAA